MDRRTFISGVAAIPFVFLNKKTKAEEVVEQSVCVEEPKVEEAKEESVFIKDSYGTKRWFKDGKRHRLDGPAVEWFDGTKEWHQNDKRRRWYQGVVSKRRTNR